MNVWLKNRDAIRLYVEAIPNDQWVARARLLTTESAQAWSAGEIDDETYIAYGEEVAARLERHADKAVAHGRFEGQATSTLAVGAIVAARVNSIQVPEPEVEPESLLALLPDRRRRGPSKVPAEVRRVRRLYLKGQAKMAKCPYAVWQHYDLAEASALSIVLLDIYERGECVRTIKQIAGAAGTSPRTVQAMYARAYDRRDLIVERRSCPDTRRSIASRATTLSAEILDYQEKLRGREPTIPLENHSFYELEEVEYEGPLEGANSITHTAEIEPAAPQAAAELEPDHEGNVIVAAVLEAREPAPEPVENSSPQQLPIGGPMDAYLDRIRAEFRPRPGE